MRNIEIARGGRDGKIALEFRFKSISQLIDEEDSTLLPDKELTELAEGTIAGCLDEYMVKKNLQLVLSIPEKELPPDSGRIIPETIRRHFSFHTNDIKHDMVISLREGMYSLVISLVNATIIIIFLYLSYSKGIDVYSFPLEILTGFLIILNWVTVWDTYEHFVYDYRAIWRKKRIYEKISLMPISVVGY